MEIYTLDRGFIKQDDIDGFESAIWNERYYGDGEFVLSVPKNSVAASKLPKGQLMLCKGSIEPMILETREIKEGLLKTTGISLTKWLNNRIVRTSADHKVKEWVITGNPGEVMRSVVTSMCIASNYLSAVTDIGIPLAIKSKFIIPYLAEGTADSSGPMVPLTIPFGPVYDGIRPIGETYEIGMNITLGTAGYDPTSRILFNTYKGVNRTSEQTVNPTIRFSPDMDSFSNITDLESIADLRNIVAVYAPNKPAGVLLDAGVVTSTPEPPAGFDLRVVQEFAEDLPDATMVDAATLGPVLLEKAKNSLAAHKGAKLVDGEIVSTGQIEYGRDYFMGDVVEVEGNTGIRQHARVTEYIRSQDPAGESAYPTLTMIE